MAFAGTSAVEPSRENRSAEPAVLSRHTGARDRRYDVRAWNLNAWCTVSGNPFVGPVRLMPNSPGTDAVAVEFGPMPFRRGTDTLTFFLLSSDAHKHFHKHEVELSVVDRSERTLAVTHVSLAKGETACETLNFGAAGPHGVSIRATIAFEEFAGGQDYGNVEFTYLLAYPGNELVDLFNAVGSDKGTLRGVGFGAVPHCYAVPYYELFRELRTRPFRLLEIGLESHVGSDYRPTDAPSLRVWRDFFPTAEIYGYDINDFSFFEQDRTTVVQGDQSSHEDLERFVSEHGQEGFGLILDDGSHAASHQQISLGALFPCVETGGLYVIEDLHWQPLIESPTTLEMLRRYLEVGRIESPWMPDHEARALEASIASVKIVQPNDAEIAVIRKRDAAG